MWVLGAIGFTAPWLLLGLAVLPLLYLVLRAVPPAPIRHRFPGVALLLGLRDDDQVSSRTPWWLLALRILALAAAIIAFAGPVLNPAARDGARGPLLIVTDASWAAARDWSGLRARLARALDGAEAQARPVALLSLTDPPAAAPSFQRGQDLAAALPGLAPRPFAPPDSLPPLPAGGFDTLWLSDGLARPGRDGLLQALAARGQVVVQESPRPIRALLPARLEDGILHLPVLRAQTGLATSAEILAFGPDPAGVLRELARARADFGPGDSRTEARFDLPPELRNRITRFDIAGESHAGAVSLAGDSLRRREIALIDGAASGREGLQLLAPTHYLEQALAPSADLIGGTLADILMADPDAIVMADVVRITPAETEALQGWIDKGGLLVRFAGPRLAASEEGRGAQDPLLPVRLRAGGRMVGGAMSWGEPKALAPFREGSPFHGLAIPADVTVSAQVMAEPDPELAERSIAALADGTPLVTARRQGQGQVILFHVTANAEWSSLPLSGLFVQMLERLALASAGSTPEPAELTGTTWVAERVLDGFGSLRDAGEMAGVAGEILAEPQPGPGLLPGIYAAAERRLAVNTLGPDAQIAPAAWPAGTVIEGEQQARETPLQGFLLSLALGLLALDAVASLWVAGRLGTLSRRATGSGAAQSGASLALALALGTAVLGGLLAAPPAFAQTAGTVPSETVPSETDSPSNPNDPGDRLALRATSEVVLAHVLTGDAETDRVAAAGLAGLGAVLYQRTSVEPGAPLGVNLETDDLALFSFLYWPVTADMPAPSPAAYLRLNRFLRTGGMILFDTRDADLAGYGGATPEGRRLQALAAPLDIPPIQPMPADHVLTRTFYLLQDFPGRFAGRGLWVEATPADAEQAEGMPFRNLNDGVTPVVIGGNDWAAAWARDARGLPMFPVGRGYAGERQREIAYRFGVNVIMHVLTGNYKSDQVHVPALLERLGQ